MSELKGQDDTFAIELEDLIRSAARTLGASLNVYWPSDLDDRNDFNEAKFTCHLAHACLSRDYFCLEEALQ